MVEALCHPGLPLVQRSTHIHSASRPSLAG